MFVSPASLALVAALIGRAAATYYCQCENPDHDRVFSGIQEPCNELSDGWCATNCNVFGASCDYCEWVPSGDTPDRDFQQLKSWCFDQSGYDSSRGQSYSGTDVFCYSNANKVSCSTCTGCAYYDNPIRKREEELMSPATLGRRIADGDDPNRKAPKASVTVDVEPVEGAAAARRDCLYLYPEAAKEMADVLTEDKECRMSEQDDNRFTIVCSGLIGSVDGAIGKFSEYCGSYGGREDDGVEVKRAEDVRLIFVD